MKYVVSANYRNRRSNYQWLIRREEDPIDLAVAVEFLEAIGVNFRDSNADEEGFGCRTVAFCDQVFVPSHADIEGDYRPEWLPLPPDSLQSAFHQKTHETLIFNGLYICRTTPLASVDQITLGASGGMYAIGLKPR